MQDFWTAFALFNGHGCKYTEGTRWYRIISVALLQEIPKPPLFPQPTETLCSISTPQFFLHLWRQHSPFFSRSQPCIIHMLIEKLNICWVVSHKFRKQENKVTRLTARKLLLELFSTLALKFWTKQSTSKSSSNDCACQVDREYTYSLWF